MWFGNLLDYHQSQDCITGWVIQHSRTKFLRLRIRKQAFNLTFAFLLRMFMHLNETSLIQDGIKTIQKDISTRWRLSSYVQYTELLCCIVSHTQANAEIDESVVAPVQAFEAFMGKIYRACRIAWNDITTLIVRYRAELWRNVWSQRSVENQCTNAKEHDIRVADWTLH